MLRKIAEIQGHSGAIYTSAYDGQFIYTGSADKFVTRWKIQEGVQDKFAIRFEQSVYALEVYDGLLFAGLSDGALHVFDLEQRIEVKHFTQHNKAIFSIVVNPLKSHIYVGDADGNLSVWDSKTLELIIYLPLDCGKIRDIAVQSEGAHFAVACQDGTYRVFETSYFNEIATIEAHKDGTTAVLFDPESKEEMITGGKDAMLRKWNWKTGQMLLEIPAHNFAIYRLKTAVNYIFSASRDKTVKIWDSHLNVVQRLDNKEGGHRHSVNDLIALEGLKIASVGDDKRILLWGE